MPFGIPPKGTLKMRCMCTMPTELSKEARLEYHRNLGKIPPTPSDPITFCVTKITPPVPANKAEAMKRQYGF